MGIAVWSRIIPRVATCTLTNLSLSVVLGPTLSPIANHHLANHNPNPSLTAQELDNPNHNHNPNPDPDPNIYNDEPYPNPSLTAQELYKLRGLVNSGHVRHPAAQVGVRVGVQVGLWVEVAVRGGGY